MVSSGRPNGPSTQPRSAASTLTLALAITLTLTLTPTLTLNRPSSELRQPPSSSSDLDPEMRSMIGINKMRSSLLDTLRQVTRLPSYHPYAT